MTTLANIEQDFSAVWAEIEANDGVLSAVAADRLDVLRLEAGAKTDAYAYQIKGLEGDAKKYRELADELYAKAKTAQSRADWLKQRVKSHLEFMGETEIKGEMWRFKLQKSGKPPVEVLCEADCLPKEFTKVTVTADREAIRAYLESVSEVPPGSVVRFGAPSMSLRIY